MRLVIKNVESVLQNSNGDLEITSKDGESLGAIPLDSSFTLLPDEDEE